VEELQSVVRLKPDSAWYRAKLAEVYMKANELDKAIEELDAAIALNPEDPKYRTLLEQANEIHILLH